MVVRQFWTKRIEEAWARRSVLWLSGVRRVGKTSLCQSLPRTLYFDCELPRVRRQVEDSQRFLEDVSGRRVILDEIHRLPDPSQLLKIAADHFPTTKLLATGSSTLGASARFRDTLTGRKTELWLTPLMSADLADFGRTDLAHRFLRGGLPPMFLADDLPERDFQEWMDAYWARDIQTLFRLERRHSFERFAELLLAQSGGIFEATRFTRPCEVSRTTLANYLRVLEATYVVHVVRPFSTHRPTEIIAAPKVYGFDTGFVCYHRGWANLRASDFGLLWEHYVLNELQAWTQSRRIGYWRDKRGHEVDLVIAGRGRPPVAIECKWSADDVDLSSLRAFHTQYPQAPLFVVAQDVDTPYQRTHGDLRVQFLGLQDLVRRVMAFDKIAKQ